jgi:hypothetical protein
MKILYLTKGDHVDYQNDCLLIGLKELYGSDIVDYNKQVHNYDSFDSTKIKQFWGQGMTVTRVLKEDGTDRTDITAKIKNKYFDYIVYGSIWRCNDYLTEILNYYNPSKIIAVDGEDYTSLHNSFLKDIQYFKRELIYDNNKIYPISFAFPTLKINVNTNKIKDVAYITPLNKQTYIYDNEADYYLDYQQSRFAVTIKKAGWDCMRHYEIMGNNCIPFFPDLEHCPVRTMFNFPKQLCKEVFTKLHIEKIAPKTVYEDYIGLFQKHFLKNNTTKALANYFINKITI